MASAINTAFSSRNSTTDFKSRPLTTGAIHGGAWSRRRDKDTVRVEFADQVVNAVPYDMPIMGYHTKNVGNLRLWQAESLTPFDFNLFNAQQYDNAVREKNRAEDISRVLYPNDDTWEGKVLRLKQQYFFCCASITDLLKDYQKYHGDNFLEFGKYFAVQLNDTHPVIAIPELVRQLTQYHGLDFEQALGVCPPGVRLYQSHHHVRGA